MFSSPTAAPVPLPGARVLILHARMLANTLGVQGALRHGCLGVSVHACVMRFVLISDCFSIYRRARVRACVLVAKLWGCLGCGGCFCRACVLTTSNAFSFLIGFHECSRPQLLFMKC